ncbi:hypothetical protein BT69DRAFT_1287855 [Atractiella rhizophila]|nr:hypothetical protein BT69DRAFT_1287855 [Atractiella rhizophila]
MSRPQPQESEAMRRYRALPKEKKLAAQEAMKTLRSVQYSFRDAILEQFRVLNHTGVSIILRALIEFFAQPENFTSKGGMVPRVEHHSLMSLLELISCNDLFPSASSLSCEELYQSTITKYVKTLERGECVRQIALRMGRFWTKERGKQSAWGYYWNHEKVILEGLVVEKEVTTLSNFTQEMGRDWPWVKSFCSAALARESFPPHPLHSVPLLATMAPDPPTASPPRDNPEPLANAPSFSSIPPPTSSIDPSASTSRPTHRKASTARVPTPTDRSATPKATPRTTVPTNPASGRPQTGGVTLLPTTTTQASTVRNATGMQAGGSLRDSGKRKARSPSSEDLVPERMGNRVYEPRDGKRKRRDRDVEDIGRPATSEDDLVEIEDPRKAENPQTRTELDLDTFDDPLGFFKPRPHTTAGSGSTRRARSTVPRPHPHMGTTSYSRPPSHAYSPYPPYIPPSSSKRPMAAPAEPGTKALRVAPPSPPVPNWDDPAYDPWEHVPFTSEETTGEWKQMAYDIDVEGRVNKNWSMRDTAEWRVTKANKDKTWWYDYKDWYGPRPTDELGSGRLGPIDPEEWGKKMEDWKSKGYDPSMKPTPRMNASHRFEEVDDDGNIVEKAKLKVLSPEDAAREASKLPDYEALPGRTPLRPEHIGSDKYTKADGTHSTSSSESVQSVDSHSSRKNSRAIRHGGYFMYKPTGPPRLPTPPPPPKGTKRKNPYEEEELRKRRRGSLSTFANVSAASFAQRAQSTKLGEPSMATAFTLKEGQTITATILDNIRKFGVQIEGDSTTGATATMLVPSVFEGNEKARQV